MFVRFTSTRNNDSLCMQATVPPAWFDSFVLTRRVDAFLPSTTQAEVDFTGWTPLTSRFDTVWFNTVILRHKTVKTLF